MSVKNIMLYPLVSPEPFSSASGALVSGAAASGQRKWMKIHHFLSFPPNELKFDFLRRKMPIHSI